MPLLPESWEDLWHKGIVTKLVKGTWKLGAPMFSFTCRDNSSVFGEVYLA